MAKRTRGSNRPGQRRPGGAPARPTTRPAARPTNGLSVDEEARAAELESRIVAQERDVETARARSRQTSRTPEARRVASQGLLAARAAEEYAYVVRDVRRILIVGGSLAAVLGVLFVLIDLLHVVSVA
jgi:hypothetical protein